MIAFSPARTHPLPSSTFFNDAVCSRTRRGREPGLSPLPAQTLSLRPVAPAAVGQTGTSFLDSATSPLYVLYVRYLQRSMNPCTPRRTRIRPDQRRSGWPSLALARLPLPLHHHSARRYDSLREVYTATKSPDRNRTHVLARRGSRSSGAGAPTRPAAIFISFLHHHSSLATISAFITRSKEAPLAKAMVGPAAAEPFPPPLSPSGSAAEPGRDLRASGGGVPVGGGRTSVRLGKGVHVVLRNAWNDASCRSNRTPSLSLLHSRPETRPRRSEATS